MAGDVEDAGGVLPQDGQHPERVGDAVAVALSADVEELREKGHRNGIKGYVRSASDARRKRIADLEPPVYYPASYELDVIGSPIWPFGLCSPTRSYALSHRERFHQVAFFCTAGGRGFTSKGFAALQEAMGRHPVATLGLSEADVHGDHAAALNVFVDAVKEAALK